MKTPIVNYTDHALRYHLINNVFGLTAHTIDGIVKTINDVNAGKVKLSDDLADTCTVSEMLDDLKIDYNV